MSGKTWYFTNEAAIALDLTANKLRHLNRSGLFKMGYHVRIASPNGVKIPRYQFHVERCSKQLETSPEKRKQY
ncbi:hypothetical protein NC981_09295 [Leptolyngbya sp. DQ-M1]|uniref:DNA-binding protein n=1 Tax=Leptolyngbya sp. DQ-M1 TaxID=2933920 RepID=UPI003298E7DE